MTARGTCSSTSRQSLRHRRESFSAETNAPMTKASSRNTQPGPLEPGHRDRRDVAVGIDAAVHRQQRLEHVLLALRYVGVAVRQLEVDCDEAHDAGAGDVGDENPRGLQRQDPRLRALGVRRQVDENVQIVGDDPLRRGALVEARDDLVVVAEAAKARGPLVLAVGKRIEAELETGAVRVLEGRPHHLAHHVVAQVGRQVADAQPAGPALARPAAAARRRPCGRPCRRCARSPRRPAGSRSKNSSR